MDVVLTHQEIANMAGVDWQTVTTILGDVRAAARNHAGQCRTHVRNRRERYETLPDTAKRSDCRRKSGYPGYEALCATPQS